MTYLVTVPLVALSVPLLLRLREPMLHRPDDPGSLRSHIVSTFRTILDRGTIRPMIVAMILSADGALSGGGRAGARGSESGLSLLSSTDAYNVSS